MRTPAYKTAERRRGTLGAHHMKGAAMQYAEQYDTRLNIAFPQMAVIDLASLMAGWEHPWTNQSLCTVNDAVVRVGAVQGEYHWHSHERDDEFFFVVSGQLFIELEDRTVELNPGQGFVVTKGVRHRPYAPAKTVMLMVENQGIVPTGDF
jgi:mannose-6-phosphate isomerase-like protein (cupin superfamily)